MAEEELIDSIVSNESLGINRKLSFFKIFAVVGVLIIVLALLYSFYVKNKSTEVNKPLNLSEAGFTTPTTNSVTQEPTVTATISADTQIDAQLSTEVTGESQPPQATASIQDLNSNSSLTSQTTDQTLAATQETQPVQPTKLNEGNTQIQSAQQPVKASKDNSGATSTPTKPFEQALTSNEKVVEKQEVRKLKRAVHKKAIKKEVTRDTQEAKTLETSEAPTLVEEGVTQEEIIVIQ